MFKDVEMLIILTGSLHVYVLNYYTISHKYVQLYISFLKRLVKFSVGRCKNCRNLLVNKLPIGHQICV